MLRCTWILWIEAKRERERNGNGSAFDDANDKRHTYNGDNSNRFTATSTPCTKGQHIHKHMRKRALHRTLWIRVLDRSASARLSVTSYNMQNMSSKYRSKVRMRARAFTHLAIVSGYAYIQSMLRAICKRLSTLTLGMCFFFVAVPRSSFFPLVL